VDQLPCRGCLRVADLGCSSGPNALALASAAVDAVRRQPHWAERCREICVYLNDLPENDFNTVFKDVPSSLRGHGGVDKDNSGPLVMVFGAPGSFYGRLFPAKTLHLVCSSFSLHWLSQVNLHCRPAKTVACQSVIISWCFCRKSAVFVY